MRYAQVGPVGLRGVTLLNLRNQLSYSCALDNGYACQVNVGHEALITGLTLYSDRNCLKGSLQIVVAPACSYHCGVGQ